VFVVVFTTDLDILLPTQQLFMISISKREVTTEWSRYIFVSICISRDTDKTIRELGVAEVVVGLLVLYFTVKNTTKRTLSTTRVIIAMFQTDGVNPSSVTNSNSRRCCRVKKTTSLDNISNGLLLLLVSHFTCQRRRRPHRCQSATTRNLLLFSWTAAVAVWLFSATPAFAVAKGKYP
jgi:hypothetical protein